MIRRFALSLFQVCFIAVPVFMQAQHLMQYTSDEYKYSLLVPEDWNRSDEVKNPRISLVLRSNNGASLSVTFYNQTDVDIDQFQNQYVQSLKVADPQSALEEKGSMKTKAGSVEYLVLHYIQDGAERREKACFFKNNGRIAVVSGRHMADQFHELIPIFNEVFSSFIFETDQEKVEAED